ncbi:MAG: prepilin-type N-terminal cleavage/methylation domain-containing protein [bacterium]|nr:prepilin-type N-terminal cleavage/methylation domain-containing protein [bacterium]
MKEKIYKGFTLIELLVVIVILGILSTLVVGNYRSAKSRGNDAKRKSDLKQIAIAVEAFMNDYGTYPAASSNKIVACPYVPGGTSTACTWGTGEFTDGKSVYFREIPADPLSSKQDYFYRRASTNTFQLYTKLENTQDKDIITTVYDCGTGANSCNYAVTSSNTSP